ncbi:MAG: EF-hand domain-containing protein [Paracoccaceae bacterium]|nr:EF-hand domain-containing protein [Paracoccaceae bacterium]
MAKPLTILALCLSVSAAPAFAQNRAADAFDRMDANGDGSVSRQEYLNQRANQFSRIDRNGDGGISARELDRVASRMASRAPSTARDLNGAMARLDTNGDGFISRREFLADMRMFRAVDTDDDGIIGPAERQAAADRLAAR